MGSLSIWHWLIVGAVVLIMFGGKGRISEIMGDVAKGIKSFKKGMSEEDNKGDAQQPGDSPLRTIEHQTVTEPGKVTDTRKVG